MSSSLHGSSSLPTSMVSASGAWSCWELVLRSNVLSPTVVTSIERCVWTTIRSVHSNSSALVWIDVPFFFSLSLCLLISPHDCLFLFILLLPFLSMCTLLNFYLIIHWQNLYLYLYLCIFLCINLYVQIDDSFYLFSLLILSSCTHIYIYMLTDCYVLISMCIFIDFMMQMMIDVWQSDSLHVLATLSVQPYAHRRITVLALCAEVEGGTLAKRSEAIELLVVRVWKQCIRVMFSTTTPPLILSLFFFSFSLSLSPPTFLASSVFLSLFLFVKQW